MWRRFTAGASVCFHLPHSEMKRGRDESAADEKSCRVGLKRHLRLILSLIVGLFGEKKKNILLPAQLRSLRTLPAAGLLWTLPDSGDATVSPLKEADQ